MSYSVAFQTKQLADAEAAEAARTERYRDRVERIASRLSAGQQMAPSIIAQYLERWNYPNALAFFNSRVHNDNVDLDFSALDQEERECIVSWKNS